MPPRCEKKANMGTPQVPLIHARAPVQRLLMTLPSAAKQPPSGPVGRCTPRVRRRLIRATRLGVSVPDAAREAGISKNTFERWLTRGRREDSGPYRELVDGIDAARARAQESDGRAITLAEVEALTWRTARAGSVAAMRLCWTMLRARSADV